MKLLPIAIIGTLFFGPIGLLAAVWAVINIGRGEYLTAVVSLGVAMFGLGIIVPFAKAVPGKLTPRGDFDNEGTTIRPDRYVDIPIQIALFGATVASVLYVIFGHTGVLDIPMPKQMRLSLPFSSAAIAVMGVPMVWRTFRRGCLHYLRLTPLGSRSCMDGDLRAVTGRGS
ncbi:hypothetical protein [Mycolicibacterium sp. XJ1819]